MNRTEAALPWRPSPRRWGAVAFLALPLLAATAPADAAEIRWKFKAGDALHYQMEQKTTNQFEVNGQNVRSTLGQTIDSTWKVESVADDGTAEMSQSLDRVRTKIEAAFGSFEYDSQDEKEPEGPIAAGVVPLLKALVGATFRYKISPRGELSDIRIPEGLVEKLKAAGPNAGNVGMFSEEGLRNMIVESSLGLPAGPVEIGTSWTRKSKIPAPPLGQLVMDKTYRYEGPAQKGDRIGLDVRIEIEPAPGSPAEVSLGDQDGKGYFIFDNAAGRVAESSVSEKVQMVIKVNGQELKQSTDTSTVMKLVEGKADTTAPKTADPK